MKNPIPQLLALSLLSACTVGPDYAGPPDLAGARVPEAAFARQTADTTSTTPLLADWWVALDDPVLTELEQMAIVGNPGLEAAQARVVQARASVRQERANRWPTAGAQATSIQANLPGLDLQANSEPPPGEPPSDEDSSSLSFYNVGLSANWEIDLAGGQKRKIEATNALAAASVANAADAQVQLTAEVARTYVALRERQLRIVSLRQEVALQERTLQLTIQRFQQGTVAAFPVGEANNDLQSLIAALAATEADAATYLNALAVLVGQAPGNLDDFLAGSAPIPLPPKQVSVGDPASLIARRPDIRAAERNLAAATARIGVAEAARFPKISFMGILGIGGTSPSDVFDLANLSTIAVPQLQWGLLDFGRTAAGIDQAEAAQTEAEARYQEIVLGALQDAENSLSRFAQQRQTVAALAQIEQSATRAAELNRQRYEAGVITLARLNAAERERLMTEANLQQATAALTASYIAIQKSLGLGWENPV